MPQDVLDGVVAIEAKAAKLVDEAKAEAKQVRSNVEQQLEELAQELDQEAEQAIAQHKEDVDAKKAKALAELDRQLEAAQKALEQVKAEQLETTAADVAKKLEQRGDGH
jgi:undecaprenyl pyrophosphate synthase